MRNFFILFFFISIIVLSGCKEKGTAGKSVPSDLVSLRTLGLAYLEELKFDEAENTFKKFIQLSPEDKFGYANLGLTYMRMGRFEEAKQELARAIKIDPDDADIRLIMATTYQMNNEREKAIQELENTYSFATGHVKILYSLAELYSSIESEDARREYKKYTSELLKYAPENLIPYMNLIEISIKEGDFDRTIELLEKVIKQFPEFPPEAREYYEKTLKCLRKKDRNEAQVNFTVFHNYIKVTKPYQAGMVDLKGPGGSFIGFPLITFSSQTSFQAAEGMPQAEVKFTDATLTAGLSELKQNDNQEINVRQLSVHIATCDFDNDGDIDIYAGIPGNKTVSSRHFLFVNETGRYENVTNEYGIKHAGKEISSAFVDYDNDGFTDLLITKNDGIILYRNAEKGLFRDVSSGALPRVPDGASKALFLDADHEGDLDLLLLCNNGLKFFRNNGNGTFTDQSAESGIESLKAVSDAVFGDFDEDGDIDIILASENESNVFLANQRQSFFKNNTKEAGLESTGGDRAIASGDYNNDGFLDIFIGSVKGNNRLYINQKNGTFKIDSNFSGITEELKNVSVTKAGFFDYDNDGFIDLLICGEHTDKNGRGLFLYHNENTKTFKNSTEILPENIKTGVTFELFDYNDDGDIDILLAETSGNIALLRNDGGNLNHFIKIRLIGLRTGSAKNNYFGIGAKVEMRAGDLYNTAVVTKQDVHFGLGSKSEVDVLRITWTNGVPQNIFMPGRDKAIVEAQLLKGSCPFLYTWDGNEFVFVKDILWRSALGMPLGIMGGTTTYGFPEASDDYIKIPGELLKMQKNLYKLNITSELWETIYLDKIELIAVDHPDSTEIFVEEQFSPPPFPGLKIYHVDKKILPASATDGEGNDLLEYISEKDDKYIAGFKPTAYQGITEVHQLILDPGPSIKEDSLFIFLNGWIFPTDASINVAISQNPDIKVIQPVFQVVNNKGEWETVIENTGFPMGKDKTMIINMSGKFLSSDHRIRIITNMEIYWDYIFFSTSQISKASLNVIPLKIKRADIHYRGFSEMYRKGGRYGPHWFNYSVIDKTIGWRDLTGNYTRYGDVLALLKQTDNKYIISNAGDEISVSFSDSKNSEIKKGWKRDFLIRSVGWVKDGDLNTLTGNTVEPLPFHGMTQYPPSRDEKFPESDDYKIYMKKYNTRVVTREGFINKLKK